MKNNRFRHLGTAATWALISSFLSVHVWAEDSAETITELTATYLKLGGYIATYGSVSEGKSVDATVGRDIASGMGVVRVTATKGEAKIEMRQWSTRDDRFYTFANGPIIVMKGLNEQLASMQELSRAFTDKPADEGPMQFAPSVLLSKSVFSAGLGVGTQIVPSWASSVKDAPIRSSDEKSVTFATKEEGLLTISRENGMFVRQTLAVEGGEPRVLEIKDLKINPGKVAIAKISEEWSTADAEEKPVVALTARMRLALFQTIIDFAEQDKVDKAKLDELLKEQYEALRHFAKACIDEKAGPFASKANWPTLLGTLKTVARDAWRQDTPGADLADEKSFEAYLQKPEVRLKLRDAAVAGIMENEKAPETVMDDIFGRGGWASLKVGNDRGVAAKKSLVDALSRAYLEALIEMQMFKQWEQRDGLD